MDDKEIEKKLKESADNIEVRDFSLVWEDIKHKIEAPKKRKRAYWLPLVASAASIVVACSIIIPLAINQNYHQAGTESSSNSSEQLYLVDQLIIADATVEEFLNEVTLAGIDLLGASDYIVVSSILFKTQDAFVKGGQLELTDDLENSTFYLVVRLYEKSVIVEEQQQIQYDFNYSVNDVMIQYRIKESYPEDGIYIYDIKANLNSANYIIEYTCFTEDIRPFLNEFFNN